MIAIASGALLAVAKRAAARAGSSTDDAVVATLFAAFAVEAWVNELLYRVRTARDSEVIGPLERLQPLIRSARLEERGTSLLTRVDVMGTVLQGGGWTLGQQPYQDLALLMEIRNSVVHQRPETTLIDVYEDAAGAFQFRQEKLAPLGERLVAAKVIQRPAGGAIAPVLSLLQQPVVARWSVGVSVAVIRAVAGLLPPGGWQTLALLSVNDLVDDVASGGADGSSGAAVNLDSSS